MILRLSYFIVVLTFLSQFIYSQNLNNTQEKGIILSSSLFGYIPGDLNEANYNLDAEIYLCNRNSLALNLGFIKSYGPSGGLFQISSLNTNGFKIQIDYKYYLDSHDIFEPILVILWPMLLQFNSQILDNTGYYVAINSFLQSTKTNRSETIKKIENQIPFSSEYVDNVYSVRRIAFGINFKFGYMCIKQSGLIFDFALGT